VSKIIARKKLGVLQNGELQHVSLSNFMLAESHVSVPPICPPWDHSSSDELIDVIINIIIVIIVVIIAHFFCY
jgi:hypothetical protein